MLRMSFALGVFHLIVFIVILARNDVVAAFHDGCWGTKTILVLSIFVMSFWLSNTYIMGSFLSMTKWISMIFLLYQALLMLVVAYKINDSLVENANADAGSCSSIILVGFTLLLTCFNGYWLVKQYIEFGSCGYCNWTMSVTLIAIVAMYGLVLLRSRADASILTSSVAACYCLYLQWAALSSDTEQEFPKIDRTANAVWQIFAGLFVTMVALFVISGSTKTSEEANLTSDAGGHILEKKEDLDDKVEDPTGGNKENVHVFAISSATIIFQLLLVLTSFYYAMLCTNWGNPGALGLYKDDSQPQPGQSASSLSFWLKLVAEWITISLYLLSLVAPLVFPDRDFN